MQMSSEVKRCTFGYVNLNDPDMGDAQELQLIPAQFGEVVKYADYAALEARLKAARAALGVAAMSLETIHEQSGRDEYMKHMDQVRGYANSRANAARAALAPVTQGTEG